MNDFIFEKLELPVTEKIEYPENYIDFLRFEQTLKYDSEEHTKVLEALGMKNE